MKLTENETNVLNYVKENGEVSIDEIAAALGKTTKQIRPNCTALVSGRKAGLLAEKKKTIEGAEKPVAYFTATDAGMHFVPSED